MLEKIKKTIESALPGDAVYVLDPQNDGQHLKAMVVSSSFEGQSILKQQQMVMQPIKDLFGEVHALELKTFTPEKWKIEEKHHVK